METKASVKAAVVAKLRLMADFIERDEYDSVEEELCYSPAGDGYGKDNAFLNFSDCLPGLWDEDLGDAIDYLRSTNA